MSSDRMDWDTIAGDVTIYNETASYLLTKKDSMLTYHRRPGLPGR